MYAFKVLSTVAVFVLSVAAQGSASQGPVTMMWGDSKPTNAALAAAAESGGMTMSSQIASAEMSMSGMTMTGSAKASETGKAGKGEKSGMSMSGMAGMSGMSGMSMETASATGMQMTGDATRQEAWGIGLVLGIAALVV